MSARMRNAVGADGGRTELLSPDAAAAPLVRSNEPPPENPSDIRRRTYVILSFWLIVLLLGLPIWWKTTTIYRANLPLGEMMEWADGKVFPSRPWLPPKTSSNATWADT